MIRVEVLLPSVVTAVTESYLPDDMLHEQLVGGDGLLYLIWGGFLRCDSLPAFAPEESEQRRSTNVK